MRLFFLVNFAHLRTIRIFMTVPSFTFLSMHRCQLICIVSRLVKTAGCGASLNLAKGQLLIFESYTEVTSVIQHLEHSSKC